MTDTAPIGRALDEIAASAAGQLGRAARRDAVRRGVGPALRLTLLVPLAAVVLQIVRLALGAAPEGLFSWWLVAAAALPALALILWRFARGRGAIGRRRALAALDRRLASGDRLLTADEFLASDRRSGFMQAAVEDAAECAERARSADVTPPPARLATRILERGAPLAAAALLVLAFWMSTVGPAGRTPPAVAIELARPAGAETSRAVDEILPPPETPEVPPTAAAPERPEREERARTRATAPVSRTIPEGAEQAEGSMGVGETSESDQSSSPSNARGAPSAQGQPSRPGEAPRKKNAKPATRRPDRQQAEQPRREASEPTGSTAGQGSSKGSNRNPAVSDWSNRDLINTPDDDQVEEEDDVDDEDEEQESRGGLQPNLRDRRPPVNRDLRIGFGNRSNPDANGRGGPGQQKKSRGVASFVLGVPIPDRVKGQPNPGKTKVTQQRIEPEPEDADPATAQARAPRDGAIEPVFHPVLDPWLRDLVRAYFLEQRGAATAGGTATPAEPDAAGAE
jgi:hypothetical protein